MNRKRMLSLLAVFVAVILIMVPGSSASADSIIMASGTCGEHLTWTLDSNCHLVISGTGDMEDYNWDAPWCDSDLINLVKAVTISDGVTSIGNKAFYGCKIVSVVIPNSVTRIGNSAFSGNSTLKKVIIPASVEAIGSGAFFGYDDFIMYGSNGSAAETYARDNNIHFEGEHGTHKAVIDAAVAPTCTENGFGKGSHCSICGIILSMQEYIPAYGHDFANDICIYCGQSYEELKLRKFCEINSAYSHYEISTDIVLSEDLDVGSEFKYITITNGAKLTIPEGITMNCGGASITFRDGTMQIDGSVITDSDGFINIIDSPNSRIIINGKLTVPVCVYWPVSREQVTGNTEGVHFSYIGEAYDEEEIPAILTAARGIEYDSKAISIRTDALYRDYEFDSDFHVGIWPVRCKDQTCNVYGKITASEFGLLVGGKLVIHDGAVLEVTDDLQLQNSEIQVLSGGTLIYKNLNIKNSYGIPGEIIAEPGSIIKNNAYQEEQLREFCEINSAYSHYEISTDIVLSEDLDVGSEFKYITITNGAKLTIPEGITMNCGGASITFRDGTMQIDGSVITDSDGFINIIDSPNSRIIINGKLTVPVCVYWPASREQVTGNTEGVQFSYIGEAYDEEEFPSILAAARGIEYDSKAISIRTDAVYKDYEFDSDFHVGIWPVMCKDRTCNVYGKITASELGLLVGGKLVIHDGAVLEVTDELQLRYSKIQVLSGGTLIYKNLNIMDRDDDRTSEIIAEPGSIVKVISESEQNLEIARKDYQYYSDVYFHRTPSNTPSGNISSVSADALANYAQNNQQTLDGIRYEGCTIQLQEDGTVNLRIVFRPEKQSTPFSYSVNQGEWMIEQNELNSEFSVLLIEGITAADFDTVYTATVCDETARMQISNSVLSYVNSALNSDQPEDLQNLAKAIYLYYAAAEACEN